MITNSIIPLHPAAQERVDAANIIKYTLLLDYEVPGTEENDACELISKIMEQCQKCCSCLFITQGEKYYKFFGQLKTSSRDFLIFSDNNAETNSQPTLHSMILQNCIMSSYHAILSAILKGYSVTAYKLCNNVKEQGIYRLYTNKNLKIDDGNIKLHFNSPGRNDGLSSKSSKASGFDQKVKNHRNTLPFLMDFMITEAPLRIQLQFSSLCQLFLDMENFKSIYKENISILKILEKMEFAIKSVEQATEISHTVPRVDSLYLQYLFERICNFNLCYSLISNIKRIEENSIYRFTGKEFISILSSCACLPNPFTRTCFLRFAFDHINEKVDSYYDLWHYYEMERNDIFMGSTRKNHNGFYFDKWFQQFDLFIKTMSQYLIPVYDWCFLTMLLECIEKSYPTESHSFHLIKAMELLTKYMSINYATILQPIKFSAETPIDGFDIISPKNFDVLKDFCINRKDDINELMKAFFFEISENNKCITDLNLTLLNPSVFKGKKNSCRSKILINIFDVLLWPPAH